ncbi:MULTISPECIES: cell envelope integrity protein TolA [unclassified Vibrio]|mgnify:CR=1 FL=1|uniref:cell envelope integrity protein TolA n=1 Tax=unclassified Vibrio TaxID=2614977 RepID=UPI001361C5F5|nr:MULTISPECIES: cell envelope integrity protein TolA [unclassified Vibrio]NAW55906.1 cell envelope integrity protein TolA [Vibrio sp. V36_P2S2PM302]NAX22618.1 cell envelope integrity protein TolA [Vibrio sp. V39_P1S14PM300]NAX26984.1 cell envelope integrity protein TolA [Vibrio sp. V38_P2S17PM301]NAX30192.1 cell envelope integrity protein TolA [Vibrio sp. V37_P2S8PM304]
MKNHKSKRNEYGKPVAISIGLHALLVAALLFGTDFTMNKPQQSGQMVQAVVIDPSAVQKQAQQIRSQREAAAKKEQERLDKLKRESEQLEKNRKAEEERIRKLKEQQAKDAQAAREAEKQRAQKEQERKAEEERVRKERERAAKLEAERKEKEAAIQKAEQERLAREKAAKEAEEKARKQREAAEKAEKERLAKEKAAKEAAEKARKEKERLERIERERKEQEAALNDIFAGLEDESAQNQAAKGQHMASEVARFSSIYTQLIQSRIIKDDYLLGKSCRVNIKLVPTGSDAVVSSVSVLGGDSRLCNAAKSAISQVGNFPMSKDPDVIKQLRNINLTVDF